MTEITYIDENKKMAIGKLFDKVLVAEQKDIIASSGQGGVISGHTGLLCTQWVAIHKFIIINKLRETVVMIDPEQIRAVRNAP